MRFSKPATIGLATILVTLLLTEQAHSDSAVKHQPGIIVSALAQNGAEVDEAVDFEGNHGMFGFQLGYRFQTGTEPFVAGNLGLGGHEAVFATYGVGVRQRLRFDRFEPFAEIGYVTVTDGASSFSLAAGGGLDLRINENWSAGIAAGHYFSEDGDCGTCGGSLDWYGRAQLSYRFGI